MDYRYETKDEARDFHKQRKAFIILNGKLEFLPDGSSMSHFEYCQTKGLNKEEFNIITIGNYTYCTTSGKCIGTFRPNDKANPYIGEKNKLEYVNEERLEVVCDINNVKRVIEKLREVHPYEEPEIDIVPLIDEEFFI